MKNYDSWKTSTPPETDGLDSLDETAVQVALDAIAQEQYEERQAERILEVLLAEFPEHRAAKLRNVAQALLGVL